MSIFSHQKIMHTPWWKSV